MTLDIIPREYWGLDPVFSSFVKLFIKDIHRLELYAEDSDCTYRYKNHPLYKVDVQGIVARLVNKEKCFICDVDDGTGVIRVCCWKSQYGSCQDVCIYNSDKKYMALSTAINQTASQDEPELGYLLHVRGNIKIYRGSKELSAKYYTVMPDPMAEISYMCHRVHLYKTVYDLPFKLPNKIYHQVMDKKLHLETGQKSQNNILIELKEKIMAYVKKHQIPMLTLQDLLTTDELISIAKQNTTNSENFVGIGKTIEKAVMEMLYQDSKSDKFSVDGSHILRIVDQITYKTSLLVNKASVLKALQKLEQNSKIISVSDVHYQICY
ncbi:CST complex subunit STN1-like isoform X2 [Tubulanus polymorphus]|uniref:CST complex subunit STN1-like isoform X2 n=1 Tax=Tubulanus polymorphus TaxID=672921 RepID=UPI003DA57BCC